MARPAPPRVSGFTLIELLVVLSVAALLMGVLLPALQGARETSRAAICSSNLAQMMRVWESAVFEDGGRCRIENVAASSPFENWYATLQTTLRNAGSTTTGQYADQTMVCPEVETIFDRPTYSNPFTGFAINSRRRPGHPYDDNTNFAWDAIRHPSSYPWFADPYVNPKYLPYFVSRDHFGATASGNWGLGFYHPRQTGRAVFVDGHVQPHTRAAALEGPVDALETPFWFLDHP